MSARSRVAPAFLAALALASAVGLVGCDGDDSKGGEKADLNAETTPESLVALANDVLGEDAEPAFVVEGADGAELTPGGRYESMYIELYVGEERADDFRCRDEEECVEVDGVSVHWREEEPEEDPGAIWVFLDDDDGFRGVKALPLQDVVQGDPRDADLDPSLDQLIELVKDERFGAKTTDELVDEGKKIDLKTEDEIS